MVTNTTREHSMCKDEVQLTRGMLEFAPHDSQGDYAIEALFPSFDVSAPAARRRHSDEVLEAAAKEFEAAHHGYGIEFDDAGAHLRYAHLRPAAIGSRCTVCGGVAGSDSACTTCGCRTFTTKSRHSRVLVLEDRGPQKANLDKLPVAALPQAYETVMDFFSTVNHAQAVLALA